MSLLQVRNIQDLLETCQRRVEEELASENRDRDRKWTESIAVGCKEFIEITKQKLGIRVKGRDVVGDGGGYQLMEPSASYKVDSDPENDLLSLDNTYTWAETV